MGLSEGSLEIKLPTERTNGQAELGKIRREKKKQEDQRRERVRREKTQVREKVAKSSSSSEVRALISVDGLHFGVSDRQVS